MRMFAHDSFGGDSINNLTLELVYQIHEKEALSGRAARAHSAEPSQWLPFDQPGTRE